MAMTDRGLCSMMDLKTDLTPLASEDNRQCASSHYRSARFLKKAIIDGGQFWLLNPLIEFYMLGPRKQGSTRRGNWTPWWRDICEAGLYVRQNHLEKVLHGAQKGYISFCFMSDRLRFLFSNDRIDSVQMRKAGEFFPLIRDQFKPTRDVDYGLRLLESAALDNNNLAAAEMLADLYWNRPYGIPVNRVKKEQFETLAKQLRLKHIVNGIERSITLGESSNNNRTAPEAAQAGETRVFDERIVRDKVAD